MTLEQHYEAAALTQFILGREEGVAAGEFETKRAVAKAFLTNDVSIKIISKSTGLSVEEIMPL